ncbi:MAG: glycosyltransferase [Verrucomicrobiota bacterium]
MISGLAEKFPRSRILSGADYQNNDHESAFPVDWVPGAFTAIRREMLEQIGFFDERYFLYYEETDLCLRARRQGWTIQFLPEAVVHHTGGGSSRKVTSETFDEAGSQIRPFRLRSECLYHRKNRGLIALLSTMGFEWGWHRLRACIHSFKRSESSRLKREHSTQLAREIERALADTSLGRISPTRPW